MQPKDWIDRFFHARDISCPDQKPLYQYRVTDEEFESLKQRLNLSYVNIPVGYIFAVLYAEVRLLVEFELREMEKNNHPI